MPCKRHISRWLFLKFVITCVTFIWYICDVFTLLHAMWILFGWLAALFNAIIYNLSIKGEHTSKQ